MMRHSRDYPHAMIAANRHRTRPQAAPAKAQEADKPKRPRKTVDYWTVLITRARPEVVRLNKILVKAHLTLFRKQHPELWAEFVRAVNAEEDLRIAEGGQL